MVPHLPPLSRLALSTHRRRLTRTALSLSLSRSPSSSSSTPDHACLYIDSVFPIQFARWDIRYYLGLLRSELLLSKIQSILQSDAIHDFKILSIEPEQKEGGLFVRFSYNLPSGSDRNRVLAEIESSLKQTSASHGGLPSWSGIRGSDVWLVKGTPWREDMDRYPSPFLKIAFEGPDVNEQSLYEILRPYGRIRDLSPPTPAPAGSLRSTTVAFQHIRSATIARNVIHGLDFRPADKDGAPATRFRTVYQKPIQVHVIRDWMSSHPKMMLPLIVFFLGTLTYTIFDPIRALMVEGKLLDWFNYQKYSLYQWLRSNALERLTSNVSSSNPEHALPETAWKERNEAEAAIRAYLTDMPNTIAFIHGPQGSGKSSMLTSILSDFDRNTLYIDCRELNKATSDSQLVASLASQTGYWPVFTFLNSVNNLIDLASVGLIGQKTGMSSSLTEQLQQILNVVATGLKGVSSSHRAAIEHQVRQDEERDARRLADDRRREKIRNGTWHDGRLDCVAGNGIMSELGVGDEVLEPMEAMISMNSLEHDSDEEKQRMEREAGRRQRTRQEMEAVKALPIVVIRNYATKAGGSKEELLNVLAQWAAMLAENQIAHVIVLSDNRENAKRLTKALPSKPLNSIALSDADAASSLSFVKQKLHDAGIDLSFSSDQTTHIERLGGRASDLESLIHKVQNGLSIKEAVDDIVSRGVGELQKNAFGDDTDDAKALPWTREQAWTILKLLSRKFEVPYYDVLADFPFKGNETALRNMEHAELISVIMKDGRPSSIRPGKPVLRWVFAKLANDEVFQATQDIALNEKLIASAEKTVKSCEDELSLLKTTMAAEPRAWYDRIIGRKSACVERAKYVSGKMLEAEKKLEGLERRNKELKRVLARSESPSRVETSAKL